MPPVRHTFVHYNSAEHRARSHSAPPEFFVDLVVACALRREEEAAHAGSEAAPREEKQPQPKRRPAAPRRRKIARKKREDDEDDAAMLAARLRAADERWRIWADRLASKFIIKSLTVAFNCAVARAFEGALPQKRATLSRDQWLELSHKVGAGTVATCVLHHRGIIQHARRGQVEIWIPDHSLGEPALREIMATANHILQLADRGEYCVVNKRSLYTLGIPFSETHTVEFLTRSLNARGRLLHRGRELTGGPLAEAGVGPGSFIVLDE